MSIWRHFNFSGGWFEPISATRSEKKNLSLMARFTAGIDGFTPTPPWTDTYQVVSDGLVSNFSVNVTNSTVENGTTPYGELPQLGLPVGSQVVLIVIYTLTTLMAMCGNVLVIIVFTRGTYSRTDLRPFLINLACSDLVMSIFCLPFTFTPQMVGTWVFSDPMCPIVVYMQTVSVTASVSTNMAIGIDRFWVVTFPFKSRVTKNRAKIVISVIWVIALGLSSVQLVVARAVHVQPMPGLEVVECRENWPEPPLVWRRVYTFFILILTYMLPLSILTLTYGIVAHKLWQRTAPGNKDECRDAQQLKSKRKVIKMLVTIVGLFGFCWLPLHVFMLVFDYNMHLAESHQHLLNTVYYIVHWIAMSNSFVNPIIYGFLNDSFRADFRVLWKTLFPWCLCMECLRKPILSRANTVTMARGTYHNGRYARHSSCVRQNSSSGVSENLKLNDAAKKLLVKSNGTGGGYDTTTTTTATPARGSNSHNPLLNKLSKRDAV